MTHKTETEIDRQQSATGAVDSEHEDRTEKDKTAAAENAGTEERSAAGDGAHETASGDKVDPEKPIDELTALRDRVTELEAELESMQDRLLRTAAEYQNFRRRNVDVRQESFDFGKTSAVEQLLDVYDDLTRTIGAIPADPVEAADALETLSQGVRLVYEKFTGQLKRLGVEPIETVGFPFDENLHEAIMQQPAPKGAEPGTVIAEVQRGYRMDDRIIRHAKVVVAGEPADA